MNSNPPSSTFQQSQSQSQSNPYSHSNPLSQPQNQYYSQTQSQSHSPTYSHPYPQNSHSYPQIQSQRQSQSQSQNQSQNNIQSLFNYPGNVSPVATTTAGIRQTTSPSHQNTLLLEQQQNQQNQQQSQFQSIKQPQMQASNIIVANSSDSSSSLLINKSTSNNNNNNLNINTLPLNNYNSNNDSPVIASANSSLPHLPNTPTVAINNNNNNNTSPMSQSQFSPVAPLATISTTSTSPQNSASASASLTGMYSQSGFDLLGVLSRLATRPNPVISLGNVDLSCSFTVTSFTLPDNPIIYASETFSRLTGYANSEIVGRNCRFLQAPYGEQVIKGQMRKFSDSFVAFQIKQCVASGIECQFSIINYRKNGDPFINLVTMIPLFFPGTTTVEYFVGLQVDMVDQPQSVLSKSRMGSYMVDYKIADTLSVKQYDFGLDWSLLQNLLPNTTSTDTSFFSQSSFESLMSPNFMLPSSNQPPLPNSRTMPNPPSRIPSSSSMTFVTPSSKPSSFSTVSQAGSTNNQQLSLPSMGGKGVSSYNLADTIISAFMGTSDFIHILSLRARFLYASPVATRSLLEYDTMADFLGHELSEFVHPADLISILRELRMTRLGDTINYLCRFRKKHSGYIYMEVSGHMFQGGPSNRKCFILSGRQINMCTFPKILLEPNSTDLIAKITSDGVILYIQPDCFKLFGIPSEKMLGRSLLDFVHSSDIESCVTSLLNCWNHSQIEKCSARICVAQAVLPIQQQQIDQQQQVKQHQKMNGVSHYAPANLQFLPSSKDSPQESTTLSRLFVRIQLLSSADPPGGSLSDIDFDTNLFEIMNETRSTSLHYELNQLRLQNLKLSEELDFLKKTRK